MTMMKKFNIIIVLAFLLLASKFSNGQSNCANTLYEANKSYEAGDFAKSVSQLLPCLKSGFHKDQRVEGYRLLALDYIYLNQPQQADTAVKNLLNNDNNYKLFPLYLNDPASLTKIIDTYDVTPLFNLTVPLIGINFANVNLTSNKAVTNSAASYQPLIGVQFGVEGDYTIWRDLHVTAGVMWMSCRYEHDFDSVAGWKQQYTENLNYVHVPVSARYYFLKTDAPLRPYIEAGASFDFLASASADIVNTDNTTGNTNSTSLNPISRRNNENTSILYGVGFNYRAAIGWFTFNARYLLGLSPIVNAANRYNDVDFIFNYQYVDDDFKLNNWQFTVGYTFPILFKVTKNRNTSN